jgi:hypothetical protein
MFVGTTGLDDQKRNNPVLKWMSDHPTVRFKDNCIIRLYFDAGTLFDKTSIGPPEKR